MRLSTAIFIALFLVACSAAGSNAPTPIAGTETREAPATLPATPTTAPQPSSMPEPSPTLEPSATLAPTETLTPTQPSGPPNPDLYSWNPVVTGLELPIGIIHSVDGSGRLFILEQAGKVRVIEDNQLLPEPFLNLVSKVGCCGERGLLGMAFHPQFTENGYFYIHYSDLNGNTRIARFEVSQEDPNRADPASERELLFVTQPYRNHNGGEIDFGPDGYLYIGLGDGGSAGDPQGNGQNTQTLLGKLLRIDVDSDNPYAIPADNPFVDGGGLPEIWAYGLRNPWRFFFDTANGDLYIGDVGQNLWEEIDYLPAGSRGGANFGWNYLEGTHPFSGSPPGSLDLIAPVAEYSHDQGCSVTGGVVYRGEALPEWDGVYFYGDYCTGFVWGLWRDAQGGWGNALLFSSGFNVSAFGIDETGEVYISDYSGGIYRLEQ